MPFTKGDPNINREGRPKGSFSLVEMIRHKLQEIPLGKDKTYADAFIEQIMKKSIDEGDVAMMRDIINRIDGMPQQTTALKHEGDITIKQIIYGSTDPSQIQPKTIPDTFSESNPESEV